MATRLEIGEPNGPKRFFERFLHPEKEWMVTGVDNRVGREDIRRFAQWFQDPGSAEHFDPPLETLSECYEYYSQAGALFLVARNCYGEPIGVLTVKREPFLRTHNKKVAYVEKMITRPDLRRKDIGQVLLTTALDYVFGVENSGQQPEVSPNGSAKPRFEECRTWVMTDGKAGNWQINLGFFINKVGFDFVKIRPLWSEYSKEVYGQETDRQAVWLYTTPDLWREAKEKNLNLRAVPLELSGKVSL